MGTQRETIRFCAIVCLIVVAFARVGGAASLRCPGAAVGQDPSFPPTSTVLLPEAGQIAALWRDLGLKLQGESLAFDDAAPLAAIRKSITEARDN